MSLTSIKNCGSLLEFYIELFASSSTDVVMSAVDERKIANIMKSYRRKMKNAGCCN
ncbi:hypothetical protein MA16_Dca007078 [Dendrobium catenatum]|uniref:Uncharacterized protein n=1 Tax=Dendrobium catenatum TaxID=906689 RepID=A0A2I0W3U3_9ASPA|nr:hypothetical protein MA16_Dca007078 [Dendrobium catenatum]